MIHKRRRKRRLELERKKRAQLGVIVGGAVIAAILAAGMPRSCSTPLQDDALRDQIEELAKDAPTRDASGR